MFNHSMISIIKKECERIKKDIILWRRDFHQYPEIGNQEYQTSKKIQLLLKKFRIPFEIKGKTGVVGFLKGNKGKTIGIRADMDALPIKEETGLPFSSKNEGFMHACGHDAHISTLLGIAKILSKHKKKINGNIKFIFQPCEEGPPGGAYQMIKEGVLDNVDFLLGFHFTPLLPLNKIWIGKGAIMATTDAFEIIIEGKGGHGSSPHLVNDPIVCASYLITQIQIIISRRVDPLKTGVISIGRINGGNVFNIIPDRVEIKGTVRTFEEEVREKIKEEMGKIIEGLSLTFNCKIKFIYSNYSPSCINDFEFSEKVKNISKKILPSGSLVEFHPILGGEDFAFFSQKKPSCYIFVGIGENCGVLHSSKFILNEEVLSPTVSYLSSLLYFLLTER